MSSNLKTKYLKWLVAAAGLLAMMLRLALLQTGVDERGLLATGHWADTGSWLLTAATIGVIFFSLRHCTGPKTYDAVFPRSMLRCAGSLIAACSFLLSGTPVVTSVKLAAAEPVLRTLAAAALVAVSFCRFRGKSPLFCSTAPSACIWPCEWSAATRFGAPIPSCSTMPFICVLM